MYSIRMDRPRKPILFYPGDISLKRSKRHEILPQPVIEADPEGTFNTTSTITEGGRSVRMYKAQKGSGIPPDGFMSR